MLLEMRNKKQFVAAFFLYLKSNSFPLKKSELVSQDIQQQYCLENLLYQK